MMTPRQRDRKARKYRLMAGELYHDLHGRKETLPPAARSYAQAAHDMLCKAFTALERTTDD